MLRFPWQPYFDSFHDLKDDLTFLCSGNSYLIFDFSSHFSVQLPSPTCCLVTLLRQKRGLLQNQTEEKVDILIFTEK